MGGEREHMRERNTLTTSFADGAARGQLDSQLSVVAVSIARPSNGRFRCRDARTAPGQIKIAFDVDDAAAALAGRGIVRPKTAEVFIHGRVPVEPLLIIRGPPSGRVGHVSPYRLEERRHARIINDCATNGVCSDDDSRGNPRFELSERRKRPVRRSGPSEEA